MFQNKNINFLIIQNELITNKKNCVYWADKESCNGLQGFQKKKQKNNLQISALVWLGMSKTKSVSFTDLRNDFMDFLVLVLWWEKEKKQTQ